MDEDRADTPGESDNDSLGDTVTHDAEPDTIKDVEADVEEVPEDVGNFSMKTADLETIVKQLQAVVTENTDLRKQLVDTESERDELKENFDVAKGIIERIADLPIGRKTQFAGAIEDFRAKYPQYDNEFVKMLEK
jgi:septal ring factor EnvC (AmiA/AmiB activator)